MSSGDDLAIILFFISTAISIALAAMTAAGWRHPLLIRSLFGLAVVCIFAGVAWPILKTISPPITAIINQIATNPVSWFVVFMLAVATSLLPPNRGTEISLLPKTAALDCVKQILIYTNSPDAPALFGGIASTNLERVKLFLDYSAYFTGLADAGWSQSRRIELAAFEPFEKDIRYEAIVVSRTSETLKWGNRPGDKDIIGSGKYRARLAFAAPGGEQYFYFMLVPTYISAGRRDVIILNQDDFSFQHEWEGT